MRSIAGDVGEDDSTSSAVSMVTGSVLGGITLLIVIIACLKLRKKEKFKKRFGGGGRQFVDVKVDGDDDAYEEVNVSPTQFSSVSTNGYEDVNIDNKPNGCMEDVKGHLKVIKTDDSMEDSKGHNEKKTETDPNDHQYTQVVKKW